MKTCCLCHRNLRETQDSVRLYSYPFVIEGRGYAHWLCFRLRIAAMRCFQDELERNTKYIPNNVPIFGMPANSVKKQVVDEVADALEYTCGYCKKVVDQDEDMVSFNLGCKHKTVHLTCLSFVDFTRKEGCPYCYSDDVRKYRQNWASNTDVVTTATNDNNNDNANSKAKLSHSYIAKTGSAVSSSSGFSNSDAKLKVDHVAITGSIIRPLFMQGIDADIIKSEYTKNMKYMSEPTYPTPMRKLVLELNVDGNGKHVISGINAIVRPLITIYTVKDMINLGLTMPMLVYTRTEFLNFAANYMNTEKLSKDFVGMDFFINILLSGVTYKCFVLVTLRRNCNDLYLIDFNLNAYWAAGGSVIKLQDFMTEVTSNTFGGSRTDFMSLLPNFGATAESLNRFFD